MGYSVTDILAGVRRRYYSTDTTAWPDADIIALVNEVVKGQVVPWIEKCREDHFIKTSDTQLVLNQNNYVLPTDVTATQLFSLHLVDSSNNVVTPSLVETELEIFTQLYSSSGTPQRYAFRGNEVILWPTPSDATYKLRFQYARRPSDLVARTAVAQITAIAPAGGNYNITVDSLMAGATTSLSYDVARANAGYEVTTLGTPVGITGNVVAFLGTSLPSNVSVGDWLCFNRQAPTLTYIPEEVWPVVYQATVVEMSSSKGDDEQLARAEKALERLIKAAEPFFTKRATAAHRKIPGGGRWGSTLWYRLTRPTQ